MHSFKAKKVSVASGAKCYPKIAATFAPETPDVGSPAVTEEAVFTTDAPTQITTDAPATDSPTELTTDAPAQQPETPEVTEPTPTSVSVASSSDGSLPTQGSTGGATTSSDGSLPTQSSAGGSTPSVPSSSDISGAAAFGDVTSASGQCVVGDPDTYIKTDEVDWVWDKRMSEYVPQFKNYIFDQLVTNNGSLNYCVRWDSTNKLEKTMASKFEAMLNRQFKAWNRWLIGYDCWPYETIDVKIVGWATRDASLFDWSDDSLGTIYEGVKDVEGVPQCPDDCYKHLGQVASADTSACKGTPFDMSLWATLGQGGGAGGDWGQRVDAENMLASIDGEQLTIVAHEIGHGFGLPDFYEPTDQPSQDFPVCIMMAGSSPTITDSDGWMLRRVLEHIKSRYKF
ncbi:hypothetical protein JM16_001338 [Phytophthora kernoviae]|uniref:Neutral zinc metallopeptidase n=1 Tax=Phytophthora kernoviae TaxID=325452 RepID=A0A8T0M9J6_9STRA|nr:hypothetical protein JM16_001338 [Phytophthora kernoviae]